MSKKTTNKRINFATSKILEYPDLLEVQLKSFKDFFQLDTTPENRRNEGLYQVFQEIFPIEDTRNNYKLEFIDYFIDPPQYSIEESTHPEYKQRPPEFLREYGKQLMRHEIVHAFLSESGLSANALSPDGAWALNEEMVDWFAIQGPKIVSARQAAPAL